MKNLLSVFTLFLGFQLFADNNHELNFIVKNDTAAAGEADTLKIMTSWDDDLISNNNYDGCAPAQNLEDLGIKIFIPDSSLTDSMPILFPPTVDEGIFINYPPYCGEIVDDQVPDHDEEKDEQK
jgi:hypothetical protein